MTKINRSTSRGFSATESLVTLPQAAKELGVPVSTLRRAVNTGSIPTHQLFNTRRRVKVSEVLAAIQTAQEG